MSRLKNTETGETAFFVIKRITETGAEIPVKVSDLRCWRELTNRELARIIND